jgi:hypothetical protein
MAADIARTHEILYILYDSGSDVSDETVEGITGSNSINHSNISKDSDQAQSREKSEYDSDNKGGLESAALSASGTGCIHNTN